MTQTTLLDADSHVSEPLNLWQERLPAKYRAIAPHMETEYQGRPGAWWFIEPDREPHNVILGFGANKSLEELHAIVERLLLRRRAPRWLGSGAAREGHGSGRRRGRRAVHHARFSHVLDQRRRISASLFPGLQRLARRVLQPFAQAAQGLGADIALRSQAGCCRSRGLREERFGRRDRVGFAAGRFAVLRGSLTIPSGPRRRNFRCPSACTSSPGFAGSIGTPARRNGRSRRASIRTKSNALFRR